MLHLLVSLGIVFVFLSWGLLPEEKLCRNRVSSASGGRSLLQYRMASSTGVRFAVRTAPWESKGQSKGLELAAVSELQLATGHSIEALSSVSADQIHEAVSGWCFANFNTAKSVLELRTSSTFVLILKGFIADRLESMGCEKARVSQIVLSVHDHRQCKSEPRAVTLLNLSFDEMDFVGLCTGDSAIEMTPTDTIPILAEIRQSDTEPEAWATYGTVASFDTYIATILQSIGVTNSSVAHKTVEKQGYFCKRIQVPRVCRDALYMRSGFFGIQFKPLRHPNDPLEEGLEVIRAEGNNSLMSVAKQLESTTGFLGCFSSMGTVYVRAKDDDIATIRKVLFPDSTRFNAENWGMKAKFRYKVMGFPAGITPVKAFQTLQDMGWIVIPGHVVHASELATVYVSTDERPPHTKFHTTQGIIQISEAERAARQKVQIRPVKAPESDTSGVASSRSSSTTDPWSKWDPWKGAKSQEVSSPTVQPCSLQSRVVELEKKMQGVHQSIGKLQDEQALTRTKLDHMAEKNSSGFATLMEMISELKEMQGGSSRQSTPVRSPPFKAARSE